MYCAVLECYRHPCEAPSKKKQQSRASVMILEKVHSHILSCLEYIFLLKMPSHT